MLYYCCRMISSQYSREFTKSEYDKLKKVCSIWICTNPPQSRKNTITEYSIQERTVYGSSTVEKETYDLIRGIMICLGEGDSDDKILQLLNTLMAEKMSSERKKKILEDKFNIEMTYMINSEVNGMCNYSDGVYAKGIAEGEAKGMAKGIAEGEAKGMAKGEKNAMRRNALEMLKDKLPAETVAKYSGLTYEEVVELQKAV